VASLRAEDIDWKQRVIAYSRKKTKATAILHFSETVEIILKGLPSAGPLFPRIFLMHEKHRAAEFKRRCRRLRIEGVTLHSYRYSWAERARTVGYPERYAMEALGHNSQAVHRAYAKGAKVNLPALEDYEKAMRDEKVIPMQLPNRKIAAVSS
jgi:integrase